MPETSPLHVKGWSPVPSAPLKLFQQAIVIFLNEKWRTYSYHTPTYRISGIKRIESSWGDLMLNNYQELDLKKIAAIDE